MKFWRGNRLAGEFDMPVAEVAAQFADWYRSHPDDVGGNLERELRYWLTDPNGFNSVWMAETGPGSFAELYDRAIGLVYDRCAEHQRSGPEHDHCQR